MSVQEGGKVGFVGQGFVGKSYADDFANRGIEAVRYALEAPYDANKGAIAECDIVFVCVPTPTTLRSFDASVVRSAIELTRPGAILVIKSTVVPGTTRELQGAYPDRTILCSPEFLSAATAKKDAESPSMNIIGLAIDDAAHQTAAQRALALMPSAPYCLITTSENAELIKYAHNANGYTQIVLWNLFYDLANAVGGNWDVVKEALAADPFVSHRYLSPVDQNGRGAGGACFVKDFAALRSLYERAVGDAPGVAALTSLEEKNLDLLRGSGKSLEIVAHVYGKA